MNEVIMRLLGSKHEVKHENNSGLNPQEFALVLSNLSRALSSTLGESLSYSQGVLHSSERIQLQQAELEANMNNSHLALTALTQTPEVQQ